MKEYQLKKLIIILVLSLFTSTLSATEQKVVYDLTTGDVKKIERKLHRSIKALAHYYTKNKIDHKIAVVIAGDAYKFFVADLKFSPYDGNKMLKELQPKLSAKLNELVEVFDVKFVMCSVGREVRDIPEDSLYGFVEAKKTKSVYLIGYQNDGYAYMPIH